MSGVLRGVATAVLLLPILYVGGETTGVRETSAAVKIV
jgi:hypothetical protein